MKNLILAPIFFIFIQDKKKMSIFSERVSQHLEFEVTDGVMERVGWCPKRRRSCRQQQFSLDNDRGLSNQQDLEINNKVNVENLWRLIFNRRGPAHTQPKYFVPNGGKVVNLSGLVENKAVNCIVKQMNYENGPVE